MQPTDEADGEERPPEGATQPTAGIDKAAAETAGSAAEKKRTLLRRFPKSVALTLLGISLSAWLLPALSRQWDDRQKARDLKGGILAQMASATGLVLERDRAQVYGDAIKSLGSGRFAVRAPSTLPQVETGWSAAAFAIEAKLLAYFPEPVVTLWRGYRELVSALTARLDGTTYDWQPRGDSDPRPASEVSHLRIRTDPSRRDSVTVQGALNNFADAHDNFAALVSGATREHVIELIQSELAAYESLERSLLGAEALIASRILDSHPTGYSTTMHDFIHDLIP